MSPEQSSQEGDKLVKPFMFGRHLHYVGMKKCDICERENAAFDALHDEYEETLDYYVMKLPETQAYYQRYTREGWQYQESLDELPDSKYPVDTITPSPVDTLIDNEAVEALLEPLDAMQRKIIEDTVNGFKPKDIAAGMGHKNSSIVRLAKYEAKRILGVPINKNMRRK